MIRSRRLEQLVLAMLAMLAVYHAALLGEGALAFPDEHAYRKSQDAATAIVRGDFSQAAASLSALGARPAESLSRLPAAFVQLAVQALTGLSPLSPASLAIAAAQNVLVAFFLGLAFFRISSSLLSLESAAVATAAFSLLTASHMWVRHIVPYDAALLVHLVALGLALTIPNEAPHRQLPRKAVVGGVVIAGLIFAYPLIFYRYRGLGLSASVLIFGAVVAFCFLLKMTEPVAAFRQSLRAGVASGMALALYPAYYSFVAAVGVFILFSGGRDRVFAFSRATVRNAVVFGTAVLGVVFAFEVLARLGGVSYLGSARLLASTITQGSFEEGFVFLGKWLWALDAPAAAWLLPAALVGGCLLFKDAASGRLSEGDSALARICSVLMVLYLFYGFQSVVMQRMVFTGRYARMYLPTLVWLAVYGIGRIPQPRIRLWAFVLSAAISGGGFIRFALSYQDVGYPADVLNTLRIGYEDLVEEYIRHEFAFLPNYNLPVKAMTEGAPYVTVPGDQRYVLVNFAIPSLNGRAAKITGVPGATLIYDRLHFCSFPATAWEGPPDRWRRLHTESRFRLRVYRKQPEGGRY